MPAEAPHDDGARTCAAPMAGVLQRGTHGSVGGGERRRVAFNDDVGAGSSTRLSGPTSPPTSPPSPPVPSASVERGVDFGSSDELDAGAAARRLQAARRRALGRRLLDQKRAAALQAKAEQQAASALQRLYRARKAREIVDLARDALRQSRAASVLQSHVRGRRACHLGYAAAAHAGFAGFAAASGHVAQGSGADNLGGGTGLGDGAQSPSAISRGSSEASVSRPRRSSAALARLSAEERLAGRGHRDRRSGAWAVAEAEDDSKEPARTERILASAFALRRTKPVDAFHSREGFFMFRVNGGYGVGRWFRLVALTVNMLFGVLSGLQPLLGPGSWPAIAQTSLVLSLQLAMACLCFRFLPDADRIISRFAASQFLLEGLSTTVLLAASFGEGEESVASDPGGGVTMVTADASSTNADVNATATSGADRMTDTVGRPTALSATLDTWLALRDSGFALALTAMLMPMLQMLEQRLVTPCVNLVCDRGCNPLALLASAYMLAVGLPRRVANLLVFIAGRSSLSASSAAGSATADAGDDGGADAESNLPAATSSAVASERGSPVGSGGAGGSGGKGEDAASSMCLTCSSQLSDGVLHAGNSHADALDEYAHDMELAQEAAAAPFSPTGAGSPEAGAPAEETLAPRVPSLVVTAQTIEAGVRASRLFARALAAKEAARKKTAVVLGSTSDEVAAPQEAAGVEGPSGLRLAARLKRHQRAARRRSNDQQLKDEEDADFDGE